MLKRSIDIKKYKTLYSKETKSSDFSTFAEGFEPSVRFTHTTLAGWHHKPLGHANKKWMGQDSNLRCFFVTDLQSAALAAGHTHPWGDQGESNPREQSHNLPDCHCPMATVAPVGLEPIISGLRGRRPDL